MNLTDKKTIKSLFRKYVIRPEKYLGQHFILSKKALNKITEAAGIKENDTVVEIGPGLGTLTQELAKTGAKVIAVEKDPLMVSILKETLADFSNIKIIQADARKLSILRIDSFGDKMGIKTAKTKYKIVANLPYNIAAFLIRQWLESTTPPALMVLMIQKEVAQRMAAKPPKMNLLAISAQSLATVKIIGYVPAEAFWPRPKVAAAIIKIIPHNISNSAAFASDRWQMLQVAKAGFSQPRKQLAGNLAKKLNLPKEKLLPIFQDLDIPERARAENLFLENWIQIAKKLPKKFFTKM